MDLGCGKGGDLKKFNFENIANYLGVDITIRGLKDAVLRKAKSDIRFPALFVCMSGDLQPNLYESSIPPQMYFDLVSAQFCIHYFFSKEISTRNFLQNVSNRLTKDGFFIATFPDSDVIMKKLEDKIDPNTGDHFNHSKYYSLVMSKEDCEKTDFYGIKYGFFLDDGLIG